MTMCRTQLCPGPALWAACGDSAFWRRPWPKFGHGQGEHHEVPWSAAATSHLSVMG